jgi:ABC-type sugar transport system ATPase subunit
MTPEREAFSRANDARLKGSRSTTVNILLSASSISKSFGDVHALHNVSFDLHPGEVHALVGENGAGKSTLIRIMSGAEQPDAGTLTVAGRAVPRMTPALAHTLGIAAIYQQPSLFPHLSVAENLALTLEAGSVWRRVRWDVRRRRASALLEAAGAAIDPARLASTLSMPEQQMVENRQGVGADAKIVIMDEPTASLDGRRGRPSVQRHRQAARARRRDCLHLPSPGGSLRGERPHHRAARRGNGRDRAPPRRSTAPS